MQMSLAVNTALMSLHSAGVFSTEPFRVGKVTHCLFDTTGTLTTEELVPAGVVNLGDSWSGGQDSGRVGGKFLNAVRLPSARPSR